MLRKGKRISSFCATSSTRRVNIAWSRHDTILLEAGTAYPSETPGFTPCFWWRSVLPFFLPFCALFFALIFFMCTQCCQYFWIVHYWLPLRFLQHLFNADLNVYIMLSHGYRLNVYSVPNANGSMPFNHQIRF